MSESQKSNYAFDYRFWDMYDCQSYEETMTVDAVNEDEAKRIFLECARKLGQTIVFVKSFKKIEIKITETEIPWPDSPQNDI